MSPDIARNLRDRKPLVAHAHVAEAAVVGRPDEMKGQAVVAFVTPKGV
jgi:acyl-coenzyme A synthetase/AMP-(fatty) acid ligase